MRSPTEHPRRVLTALLLAAAVAAAGCDDGTETGPPVGPEATTGAASVRGGGPTFAQALRAQERHDARLRGRAGVVGTAVGLDSDGSFAVVLYLMRPEAARGLPPALDGVPVEMVVTGPFVADADETSRQRPAPVGFSVGHPDITAGTLGARVVDGSGTLYILSNNHVLADVNEASIGDPTLQPGPYDGGTAADSVAWLADYVPISFSGTNYVDAAIAQTVAANVDSATSSEGYGAPNATIVDLDGDGDPNTISTIDGSVVGTAVQKYGRTTGLTRGSVEEVSVSVNVCYVCANPVCTRCAQSAHFEDQISITPGDFSDGGDSGSLIVTDDASANPVGLLYAGSSSRTLANRVDRALDSFGVTVDGKSGDGGGGDTTDDPPTVSVTSPSEGATVSGTITLEASASDDNGVSQVEFFVDGTSVGTDTEGGDGWSTGWDTNDVSDGDHDLTAEATDTSDQTTLSSAVTVTVDNHDGSTAGGIHVGDLDGSSTNEGSTWTATVTVLVHDADDTAEEGSTVSFSYTSRDVSGSASCTTGTGGACSFSVSAIPKRSGSLTVTVDGVSDPDGSYDAASNHDPDGDSDGTAIEVSKP